MSMRFSHIGRLIAGLVIAATVAACGGGGGGGPSGSDPTATVKDMIATVTAGNYDKLADFACAAQKDEITQQFDPSSLLGGDAGALGLSAADLKQVITFTVSGLDVKEKSKDATTAVVSMTGKMKININKDKFKELMKKALEADSASRRTTPRSTSPWACSTRSQARSRTSRPMSPSSTKAGSG